MRTLELPRCPACGGNGFRVFDLGAGNMLRRCSDCDTVFAPSYADPSELYVDGYMFGETGPAGFDVRHPVYQRYLVRVAHERIGRIEKATGIRGGSLLDVGAGTGEVLMVARERGWRTTGVEPEQSAAEMARSRGLEVVSTTLEDSGLPKRSFDVVSAFHVLEHVPDSRAFLQALSRWARPGGVVALEVPNFSSVQRRRARERWSLLRPGEHLVHYTPQTLERTVRAAGIDPVLTRSPTYIGPPQSLDHALADLGRPQGAFRKLLRPLSRARTVDGASARYPTRAGWAVLRGVEAIHDRAGVGSVVLCLSRVRADA